MEFRPSLITFFVFFSYSIIAQETHLLDDCRNYQGQWVEAMVENIDLNTKKSTEEIEYLYLVKGGIDRDDPDNVKIVTHLFNHKSGYFDDYYFLWNETIFLRDKKLISINKPLSPQKRCEEIMGGFYDQKQDKCRCHRHGDPEERTTKVFNSLERLPFDKKCDKKSHRVIAPRQLVCDEKGGYATYEDGDHCFCHEYGQKFGEKVMTLDMKGDELCPSLHNSNVPSSYHIIDRVTQNCIENRYWEADSCHYESATSEDRAYYMNPILKELWVEPVNRGYKAVAGIIGSIVDIPLRMNHQLYGEDLFSYGVTTKDEVFKLLQDTIAEKPRSDCQKACLVKCFSSNILSYKFRVLSKFGSPSESYLLGEGVCTEYAAIADQLAGKIDLPSKIDVGVGHAFTRVKIDGQWYISEAMEPDCTFYEPYEPIKTHWGPRRNSSEDESNPSEAGPGIEVRRY